MRDFLLIFVMFAYTMLYKRNRYAKMHDVQERWGDVLVENK